MDTTAYRFPQLHETPLRSLLSGVGIDIVGPLKDSTDRGTDIPVGLTTLQWI